MGEDVGRVVLPEGEAPRIIQAAALAAELTVARPLLLGSVARITDTAQGLGIALAGVDTLDPATDDRAGTIEMMAPLFGLPPDDLDMYPHACIGTTDEICESLEARRARWDASYITFQGADAMEAMAPVVAKLRGS